VLSCGAPENEHVLEATQQQRFLLMSASDQRDAALNRSATMESPWELQEQSPRSIIGQQASQPLSERPDEPVSNP
jgi:hypothetical protein